MELMERTALRLDRVQQEFRSELVQRARPEHAALTHRSMELMELRALTVMLVSSPWLLAGPQATVVPEGQ
ncbi:MAG TPA: hypothetical protein DC054_16455 [Blastocatellia bacterium]|nr:hypothetical protein [Blastocatellia bacterium]